MASKRVNAFTLFEILVSLIILSIVTSGVLKLFKAPDNLSTYYKLIDVQNNYEEFGTIKETKNIKFSKTIQ